MRAILIDDEPLALDFLGRQLKKISDISIVHKFVKFNLNKDGAILEDIDVVFLDIEMPAINGLELAEKMLEIKPTIIIVFVTAFSEYAVQAFELNTLDYIVKPIQLDRLEKTLERIRDKINHLDTKRLSDHSTLQISLSRDLSFKVSEDDFKIV